jgi:hypothetical protein
VPGLNPFAVVLFPPVGDQLYVSVPVPPLAVTVAVPLLAPLQVILVVRTEACGPLALITFAVAVAVHPLTSVINTEYVPADNPVAVVVV